MVETISVRFIQDTIPVAPETSGLHEKIRKYLNGGPESWGSETAADEVISIMEEGASLVSDVDPEAKGEIFAFVGLCYENRFERSGNVFDLDQGIKHHTQALSFYPTGHVAMPFGLNKLGELYGLRFNHLGELADFDRKIDCLNEAIRMAPIALPEISLWFNELGNALATRFYRLRVAGDIDSAIECYKQALLSDPDPRNHVHTRICMNGLGGALLSRFEHIGDLDDIDSAIVWFQRAQSLVPHGNALHAIAVFRNLGISHQCRFERTGNIEDIETAISYLHQTITLAPDGHTNKAECLNNLGICYRTRFKRLGNIADIDLAIGYQAEAVSLTPDGQPDLADYFGTLGTSHQGRFDQLGKLPDVDRAIHCKTQALFLTSVGHPSMPGRLNNLAASFIRRFECLGELADVDKAINYLFQAISLKPDEGPNLEKPQWLNNLGASYLRRFERLGELEDIDKAIEHHARSVALTPNGYPDRPARLSNLSVSLQARFLRTGELEDLDSAIECSTQVVLQTPDGHADRSLRLNTLALAHQKRYDHLGGLEDVDRSIEYLFQAVSLTDDTHAAKPRWLHNLGVSHHCRYKVLGELADIDKAIACNTQSVSLTPAGSHDTPRLHSNLGLTLRERYERSSDPADLALAVYHFKTAAESEMGYPFERFLAASHWGFLSFFHRISSPLDAYRQVMALIPQVVWLGSSLERRYDHVVSLGSAATEAAVVAIESGAYDLALEWLEQGRSIIWSQLFQLRAPLGRLATSHPLLAEELAKVACELDLAASSGAVVAVESANQGRGEQESQRHRRLAERWEELLKQVRSLPGFETFLQPRKARELVAAAQSGPVVMVNVHPSRSDALIIQPGTENVAHIPLTNFSYQKAVEARNHLAHSLEKHGLSKRGVKVALRGKSQDTFGDMLSTLWECVVKPVIDFLGFIRAPESTSLPRITWCTTGPLSFLPLHAAGDYTNLGPALFDLAISSYTPTIGALLASPSHPSSFSGILTIGQSSTPGLSPLPMTVTELDRIGIFTKDLRVTRLEGDRALTEAVLANMETHSWIHLASHATQHPADPSKSAFHLHDGALTLGMIMQKSLPSARLAFLSACQTAAGDENLSEEAMHLAAGMIIAGYPTVMATMWSIHDEDAPVVTEKVYAQLLGGGTPDAPMAAEALHTAVGVLRDRVGVKEFARWVPYVHIGL
ncbi:hypothetical protein FRC09_000012 [Ceratobasidium sp. 395]|nr:hypothetical protein FRC09_000012 [Ceratobasidium sp. 395]